MSSLTSSFHCYHRVQEHQFCYKLNHFFALCSFVLISIISLSLSLHLSASRVSVWQYHRLHDNRIGGFRARLPDNPEECTDPSTGQRNIHQFFSEQFDCCPYRRWSTKCNIRTEARHYLWTFSLRLWRVDRRSLAKVTPSVIGITISWLYSWFQMRLQTSIYLLAFFYI